MSTTVDSRTRATGTGKPRQKAQLSDRARSERKLGWLLAGPAFVIMLLVTLYPIVQALWDSLFSFRLTAPGDKEFVGLSNYATVFSDIVFWRDLGVTVLPHGYDGSAAYALRQGATPVVLAYTVTRGRCGQPA